VLDKRQVRDAPQETTHRQEAIIQPAGSNQKSIMGGEVRMGMVMIKCPQTGRAIPTGIQIDRERFRSSPVFFSRTRCPGCQADHAWFAREAWVDERAARAEPRRVAVPA
jgi:hypothetical protein